MLLKVSRRIKMLYLQNDYNIRFQEKIDVFYLFKLKFKVRRTFAPCSYDMDKFTLLYHLFLINNATVSTCAVWGNISMGVAARVL